MPLGQVHRLRTRLTNYFVRLFCFWVLIFPIQRLCVNEDDGKEVPNGYSDDFLCISPPPKGGELGSESYGATQ